MSDQGLRIAFLGTAEFAVPTLRLLAKVPHAISAVFTRPDRPAGRGRRLRASPIKQAAQELDLPLLQPELVSAGEGLEALRKTSPDLLFVAAFGEILTPEVLSIPRLGAVNIHASLLPRYRGAAPIQRALMAGEAETGVTVQWMAPELDAGDIILQRWAAIGPEEDFGGLHERLALLGGEAAAESLTLVEAGAAPRIPQDEGDATYAPPIRREELAIDWRGPAGALVNLVRALSPRPGARTTRRGQLLKVLAAREGKNPRARAGIPGTVMELTKKGFWVSAGEGRLLVVRVQPAGRKPMPAADYPKGYRLECGELLGA